jgi:hypothetical protein
LRSALLRFIPLKRRLLLRLLGVRMTRSEIGLLGEHLAVKYLHQNGRRVLYRNYIGIHRGDFWSHSLAGYDLVYAFLSPAPMANAAGTPAKSWPTESASLAPAPLLYVREVTTSF